MRKIILYIAASLDGYIARSDGRVDWLEYPEFSLPGEDFGYKRLMNTVDATLMGNSTYRVILGFGGPFPYPDTRNFVFTRSAGYGDNENVRFISEDPVDFVRQLKKETGKDIWLIGGGQINTLLLNHGLIDSMILTVFPLVLGGGIPLFAGIPAEHKWSLKENRSYSNGLVQLVYTGTSA